MNDEQLREIVEPKLPDTKDIILSTGPLLGLGDHAIYTTLPERYTQLGYDVYLDKDNATSNPGIMEALWENNPFIKGLSDKKPNAGYVWQGRFYEYANRLPGYRSIEAMERAHGLPPPYGMAPKIYYTPKPFLAKIDHIVLLDFSAVSSHIGTRGLNETMKMMNGRFRQPHFLQVVHKKHVVLNMPIVQGASTYQPKDIFEYLDMLHACRGWVGSEAGGQSLAAAVRGEHEVYDEQARLDVVCVITPPTFNSRGYTYRNVDYRVTSDCDTSADYHSPVEIEVWKYQAACKIRQVEMGARLG